MRVRVSVRVRVGVGVGVGVRLDGVLLHTVQRQLGVVDVDLHGVLHELLADDAHLARERGREHHDLVRVRVRVRGER